MSKSRRQRQRREMEEDERAWANVRNQPDALHDQVNQWLREGWGTGITVQHGDLSVEVEDGKPDQEEVQPVSEGELVGRRDPHC